MLYTAYTAWAEENGERPASQKAFGLRLTERGFISGRGSGGGRLWAGLRLREGK